MHRMTNKVRRHVGVTLKIVSAMRNHAMAKHVMSAPVTAVHAMTMVNNVMMMGNNVKMRTENSVRTEAAKMMISDAGEMKNGEEMMNGEKTNGEETEKWKINTETTTPGVTDVIAPPGETAATQTTMTGRSAGRSVDRSNFTQ